MTTALTLSMKEDSTCLASSLAIVSGFQLQDLRHHHRYFHHDWAEKTWPPYQSKIGFYTTAQPKMVPTFSFIDFVIHCLGLTAVKSVKCL